nr:hypothetical protein CFP56_08147 [Quercus suber]
MPVHRASMTKIRVERAGAAGSESTRECRAECRIATVQTASLQYLHAEEILVLCSGRIVVARRVRARFPAHRSAYSSLKPTPPAWMSWRVRAREGDGAQQQGPDAREVLDEDELIAAPNVAVPTSG